VAQLELQGFDTVINCAKEWPSLEKKEQPKTVKRYLHLDLLDESEASLEPFLNAALGMIKNGNKVLVHCIRGSSRSPAILW
jgi:protein-tyrosine phosphatase